MTDIEIAQSAKMKDITEIAGSIGISDIELYGKYKAKINVKNFNPYGNLILVTAISPTPAGEGKTTTSIGLADALHSLNKSTILCLREPSLGPNFGIKGGACGGGYSQVVPMEDINLHFTGDIHAITSAHNLLAAVIDNSIFQDNPLNIKTVTWKRVLDLNDRALRNVEIGLGGEKNGIPRYTGFDITVASEIMAILCLSNDLMDLKKKISNIIIGYDMSDNPVYVRDLNVEGSLALLLKDAIKPNLVQTLEHTPCIIHGGPFANIAHGCNSLIATKTALSCADYVVTEAGFGADLGAEKFFDIKCRMGNLKPKCVVLVATIRAIKMHGGVSKDDLKTENIEALKSGISNLKKHIENILLYNVGFVIAVNRFDSDTDAEIDVLMKACSGYDVVLSEVFSKGSKGGISLAEKVLDVIDKNESDFRVLYETNKSIKEKISIIATNIYGAKDVLYTSESEEQIKLYTKLGYDKLPICIAKTQYSFSDNEKLLGRPTDFTITIKELRLCSGAGFIVALTGKIMTMPGLPKEPIATKIDIDEFGVIKGLF